MPPELSDFHIEFDESMRVKNYGTPNVMIAGIKATEAEMIAELLGIFDDNLNKDLFYHYLNNKGSDFDVTDNETIKTEVQNYFSDKMNTEHDRMRSLAEKMTCPSHYSGDISSGDEEFLISEPRINYISKVKVIGHAFIKLEKKTTALLTCCAGKAIYSKITSTFRMYFYDQFADAGDWFHKKKEVVEYMGGTQFEEIGA